MRIVPFSAWDKRLKAPLGHSRRTLIAIAALWADCSMGSLGTRIIGLALVRPAWEGDDEWAHVWA
jgi:hypothetical protein